MKKKSQELTDLLALNRTRAEPYSDKFIKMMFKAEEDIKNKNYKTMTMEEIDVTRKSDKLAPRDDDWDMEDEGEEEEWEPSTCNVCGTETDEENCHMCKIGTTVEPIPWIEYQDGLDG